MNDSDQEIFHFLMKMVPRNMDNISNSMNLELIEIRKNLIRKSRIITEFRYFLKRYLSDSKTEKKVKKFEADYFNSPTFKSLSPTDPKHKTMRKSISIDQEFLNCLLNNEEIIGVASPTSIKRTNKSNNYDSECFVINSEDDFVSYLFSPKEVTPFLGLSLVSQNSSVIINYIHENPSPFIQCLIKNQNHPNYVHITQSIIPSIFGYFSSLEYLDYASNFYIKLLSNEEVTPEIATPILAPFFNSPASYRFTEKVYSEFFKKIAYNKNEDDQDIEKAKIETQSAKISPSPSIDLNKASSFNISTDPRVINARLLNSCILKAVPLLPAQFFNIFKQLRVRRWTMHDWYNLFFKEFILISMNQWIRSSFCDEYVEILFDVMSRKFVSKKELAMLFKNILKQSSIYEPPQLFQCFKSPSTLYLLNIRNMQLLVSFLNENKILPPSVDTLSFDNIPPKYKYSSFWCNVYSRRSQSSSSSLLLFDLEEVKKSEEGRLVFQSYDSIRDEIEDDEKNPNFTQFQKEFRSLQTLAKKYDQTNTIEFILNNSGKDEFHQFAQKRCLKSLIDLADDFEEVMELLRRKESISDWTDLLQSNENMLVLSHISMFEKRMDVVQLMPTFIKQAIFLNRIDESKFNRFADSLYEIGSDWDLIAHSPHFSPFKNSTSLSYAPSPTINKSKDANPKQPNKNSNVKQQQKKSNSTHKKKMVNSSSSPNLSNINDNDNNNNDKSPNISEVSSDTESPLFSPISERNDKIQKLRRISINYSNSDFEKINDQNSNDSNIIHISRSMSSDGLFINKSTNKVEPFSPLSHLPNAFFETLDLISLINHVRLPEKFLIMMKVLEQIEFFSNQPKKKDFSLLVILLQNIPGQVVISMYIVLNVFAMREPNIFLLCSEMERKRWLNFEQIILKCASENFNFLSKLLNLQSAIQDEFNKWKDKNFKNW